MGDVTGSGSKNVKMFLLKICLSEVYNRERPVLVGFLPAGLDGRCASGSAFASAQEFICEANFRRQPHKK